MPDVDIWKVEVPAGATPETPWHVTRVSRQRYYQPTKPERAALNGAGRLGYSRNILPGLEVDSDVEVVINKKEVSLTPMSLDLTSRIDLGVWEESLKATG
jgi:5'-nucleotidase